jgi:hypothetical protein
LLSLTIIPSKLNNKNKLMKYIAQNANSILQKTTIAITSTRSTNTTTFSYSNYSQTSLYTNAFSYRGIMHPQQMEGPCFVEDMSKRSNIRNDIFYGSIQIGIPLRLVLFVFAVDNNQCHVNDISSGSNSSRINFTSSNSCLQLSNTRFDL